MATIFWDSEGVVLVDFLENQKTVTGAFYAHCTSFEKIEGGIIKKRPGKLHLGIVFHRKNAPAHSARVTKDILREFR